MLKRRGAEDGVTKRFGRNFRHPALAPIPEVSHWAILCVFHAKRGLTLIAPRTGASTLRLSARAPAIKSTVPKAAESITMRPSDFILCAIELARHVNMAKKL